MNESARTKLVTDHQRKDIIQKGKRDSVTEKDCMLCFDYIICVIFGHDKVKYSQGCRYDSCSAQSKALKYK